MAPKYSEEKKAAVLAALLEGQAVTYVAKEYQIPRTTIQTWKEQYENGELTNDSSQKKEIGSLLVEYLAANLETLRAQLVVFRDESWLKRSDAEGVAVLHGVLTDKAIRLLEALGKNNKDGE